MLTGTPFHPRVVERCESHEWQRWSGFLTAAMYDLTHDWEYHALRGATGMIDISPIMKYRVSGPDAETLLNRVVTRDVSRCKIDHAIYTPWCDSDGKMLDDGIIQRLDTQDFRLTAAEPNFHWLHENAFGLNVSIEDESTTVAGLALQGPTSQALLQTMTDFDLTKLRYFGMATITLDGVVVTLTRTGFTGDLGFELWLDPEDALTLWDGLMDKGQAYNLRPVGMHALGIARVEAGLILNAVDYTPAHHAITEAQKSSPFELGLGWAINFKKGMFVGRKALLAEQKRGPRWRFVGLEIDMPALEQLFEAEGLPPQVPYLAWRDSVPLYVGRNQIGYATSGCYSPILKQLIALATVEAAYGDVGTELMIEVTVAHQRKQAPARVVKTPFFNPARKRA